MKAKVTLQNEFILLSSFSLVFLLFYLQISSKCCLHKKNKENLQKATLAATIRKTLHDFKMNFNNLFSMILVLYFSQPVCIHATSFNSICTCNIIIVKKPVLLLTETNGEILQMTLRSYLKKCKND